MQFKEKSKLWYLTFPFAHNNRTLLGNTIYYPKGTVLEQSSIRHEEIHVKQMAEVGLIKFYLLYLFALPFIYNPWRYKWELEAYTLGSNMSEMEAKKVLRSKMYGWLRNQPQRKK
jgi:hypothetical protein